ncbi:MAG: protein-disulfide reductase DsbD domain-containing protein [Bacteroidota bacterium]
MKKILIIGILLLAVIHVQAQIENPVHWSYASKRTSPTTAVLFLKATIDDGWHIYSQKKADNGGPVSTSFIFRPSADYTLVGATAEPEPITRFEPSFSMNVSFFEHAVIFQQKIKLKPAKTTVKGTLKFMVCNDEKCLPPDNIDFVIPVGK